VKEVIRNLCLIYSLLIWEALPANTVSRTIWYIKQELKFEGFILLSDSKNARKSDANGNKLF
jgi:hypothetical protein